MRPWKEAVQLQICLRDLKKSQALVVVVVTTEGVPSPSAFFQVMLRRESPPPSPQPGHQSLDDVTLDEPSKSLWVPRCRREAVGDPDLGPPLLEPWALSGQVLRSLIVLIA